MKKKITLPDIPEQEQTPSVKSLLVIIEQLVERVEKQDEEIAHLKDEIVKPDVDIPDQSHIIKRTHRIPY